MRGKAQEQEHPALLWKPLARADSRAGGEVRAKHEPESAWVRCRLCSHFCVIGRGEMGFCHVRGNRKGRLYSLNYGLVEGLALDPIEKKPFFNFRPGTRVLSFGSPGCNFRCLGCQNWELSQGPRLGVALPGERVPAKRMAGEAVRTGAAGLAYTYSEPTIFFEYARDCVRESKKLVASGRLPKDFYNVFVTNGYFSKEMLAKIARERLLDAMRIDLKFMNGADYKSFSGARLEPVLENIRAVAKTGMHMEVIVLVIPGMNDKPAQLKEFASFVAAVGKSVPLHFIRFHPDYRVSGGSATPIGTLEKAREIAREAGIEYAYIGNTGTSGHEDTLCPGCGELLIERRGFGVVRNAFKGSRAKRPTCPACGHKIAIIF